MKRYDVIIANGTDVRLMPGYYEVESGAGEAALYGTGGSIVLPLGAGGQMCFGLDAPLSVEGNASIVTPIMLRGFPGGSHNMAVGIIARGVENPVGKWTVAMSVPAEWSIWVTVAGRRYPVNYGPVRGIGLLVDVAGGSVIPAGATAVDGYGII